MICIKTFRGKKKTSTQKQELTMTAMNFFLPRRNDEFL